MNVMRVRKVSSAWWLSCVENGLLASRTLKASCSVRLVKLKRSRFESLINTGERLRRETIRRKILIYQFGGATGPICWPAAHEAEGNVR
jgi:hypothetical protein